MSKLTEFAKGMVGGCRLMENREKVNTDDVVGVELTMRDFEMLTGDNGKFPVIIFDEMPDKFYMGGKVLSEICNGIDANGLHESLVAEGLRIVLTVKLTKAHKPCVSVKVLD